MSIGYGTTLTVRRQQRNSDGDLVGSGVDTALGGWLIAPANTTEQADGTRDSSTLELDAYGGPAQADIRPGDRVYLADDPRLNTGGQPVPPPWQVVGWPQRWGNPLTGWEPGNVVRLRRVTG